MENLDLRFITGELEGDEVFWSFILSNVDHIECIEEFEDFTRVYFKEE